MPVKLGVLLLLLSAAPLQAASQKTEVVEEQEKTDSKQFCAKVNEREAELQCESWLEKQKKALGDKLLTSHCSAGTMSTDTGCLYQSTGEIKYMLKKYRSETLRD